MEPVLTKEIIKELEELNRRETKRFVDFYNGVFRLLTRMPENSYLTIEKVCRKENIELFQKFAMLVMDDLAPHDGKCDYYEFNDDMTEIHHKAGLHSNDKPFKKSAK